MKILMVASECVPFAKTGGLADVVGALPKFIRDKSHDIRIIIPKYKKINDKKFRIKSITKLPIIMGEETWTADIKYTNLNSLQVFFVDNKHFFDREELYRTSEGDYPDNAERFIFFCKAVLELTKAVDFKPDIIHCNDWQTALIPAYLKTTYKYDSFFINTRSIFTIHNLAYQGLYPKEILPLTGIGWEEFTSDKIEYWDQINFIKAGLVYADVITTVSPTYSKEIQTTEEYGRGLEGVLASRAKDLYGIINGVDYEEWDPGKDKFIITNYNFKNFAEGKNKCKEDLLRNVELTFNKNVPVIGMISRLDPQKGLDILAEAIEEILSLDLKFVLLGKGDKVYQDLLEQIKKKYSDKASVNLNFDESLAHKIYAGIDVFLMPSHFEPCGLGQLISFKYGVLPIVYKTGGLADTVLDYNEKTGKGNGFLFTDYTASALVKTVKRTLEIYKNKKVWQKIVSDAIKTDFSWNKSADAYLDLYSKINKK